MRSRPSVRTAKPSRTPAASSLPLPAVDIAVHVEVHGQRPLRSEQGDVPGQADLRRDQRINALAQQAIR